MKHQVPYPEGWLVIDDKELAVMDANPDEAIHAAGIRKRIVAMQHNPLRFFKPHGGQLDFLNNQDKELIMLHAPNQIGKTVTLIAWLLLWTIPTKPDWECYKENNIDYREWEGPQNVGIASYSWKHIQRNIWPKMIDMLPLDEIRHLVSKDTPENMIRARAKAKDISNTQIVYLGCGSSVQFYCYTQSDAAFASATLSRWALDEQIPDDQFDEAYARLTTADNYQIGMAYTPHVVDGRPDTGAGHWTTELLNGTRDKGLKFADYQVGMDEVPTCIIKQSKKDQLYERYIAEPTRKQDMRALRRGKARYYGIPEPSSGLVYESWTPELHWIDPFEIPSDWPRYRTVDPGYRHPCGALWAALSPWGDCVLYREYYKTGLGIGDNVKGIIEAGGNSIVSSGLLTLPEGVEIIKKREVETRERYVDTVLDPRCYAKPSTFTNVTLGDQYRIMGLECRAGDARHSVNALPMCREWFEPVKGREHILLRMKLKDKIFDIDGNEATRAPRLYVFDTLQNFRWEIDHYQLKPEKDEPIDKDDHLMTALKYLLLALPTITPAHILHEPEVQTLTLGDDMAVMARAAREKRASRRKYWNRRGGNRIRVR